MMSVERIAEALADRFHLLTGGTPCAIPRQATLRASVDWSYELLPEAERALLRQLSVFAGGLSLDAAEHVGAAGGRAVTTSWSCCRHWSTSPWPRSTTKATATGCWRRSGPTPPKSWLSRAKRPPPATDTCAFTPNWANGPKWAC